MASTKAPVLSYGWASRHAESGRSDLLRNFNCGAARRGERRRWEPCGLPGRCEPRCSQLHRRSSRRCHAPALLEHPLVVVHHTYDGIYLEFKVRGSTSATGVSDASGTMPRYGEVVLSVLAAASTPRFARQSIGM